MTELIESMIENGHVFVELRNIRRADGGLSKTVHHMVVYLHHCTCFTVPTDQEVKTLHLCRWHRCSGSTQELRCCWITTIICLQRLEILLWQESSRANPSKTRVCLFHLRNRQANRHLVGYSFGNCDNPVHLCVTQDRYLSCVTHVISQKLKSLQEITLSANLLEHDGAQIQTPGDQLQ